MSNKAKTRVLIGLEGLLVLIGVVELFRERYLAFVIFLLAAAALFVISVHYLQLWRAEDPAAFSAGDNADGADTLAGFPALDENEKLLIQGGRSEFALTSYCNRTGVSTADARRVVADYKR